MKKILWSPEATEDLRNIYHFYLDKNPKAAFKLYSKIRNAVRLLIHFPNLAPLEPFLKDESHSFRSLVVAEKFKLIYYIDKDIIHLVKVWDCRQNPETLKSNIER